MDAATLTLIGYLKTAFYLLLVIPILVAVHELGHFWFARLFGMRVEAFAVMMGGIRKTDLTPTLPSPMVSGRLVGGIGFGLAVATAAAGLMGHAAAYQIALGGLAIGIPMWIASRIQHAYHLSPVTALTRLAMFWGAGLMVLGISSGPKGLSLSSCLAVTFFTSLIALLTLYYTPVMGKSEESPQGEGELMIQGKVTPVQFRPIWCRKDRHGTEFSLLALPLGGFATIHGMHAKEDGSETQVEHGFYSKSAFARWMVLFAGPLFSILFGIACLTGSISIQGKASDGTKIGSVEPGSAAFKAGIKPGDRFISINGQPVKTWWEFMSQVQPRPKQVLDVRLERGSETLTYKILTQASPEPRNLIKPDGTMMPEKKIVGMLGVRPGVDPVSIPDAFSNACKAPVAMVLGLMEVIKKPSIAKENLGGPASVAQVTHEAAAEGPVTILRLAGLLSISLGVMNLLPIVPLDGGQMMVAFIEGLRKGRRLSIHVQRMVANFGVMLVMGLMLLMLVFDISKFAGK